MQHYLTKQTNRDPDDPGQAGRIKNELKKIEETAVAVGALVVIKLGELLRRQHAILTSPCTFDDIHERAVGQLLSSHCPSRPQVPL